MALTRGWWSGENVYLGKRELVSRSPVYDGAEPDRRDSTARTSPAATRSRSRRQERARTSMGSRGTWWDRYPSCGG